MKTIQFLFIAVLVTVFCTSSYSQTQDNKASLKTETLKVWGNCDMCKSRVEKASKLDGVSKSEWSKESKILTVSYNPSITNMDAISKKVAEAGHDNEKLKAAEKDYNALPGCCKYDRSK